mmetsp:Transcript_11858/g.30950  ORF Transcript_11858/g.30950 Transcript_11858/m.30950 type:complete len:294 (+) Transcript_11858:212-1093(+)
MCSAVAPPRSPRRTGPRVGGGRGAVCATGSRAAAPAVGVVPPRAVELVVASYRRPPVPRRAASRLAHMAGARGISPLLLLLPSTSSESIIRLQVGGRRHRHGHRHRPSGAPRPLAQPGRDARRRSTMAWPRLSSAPRVRAAAAQLRADAVRAQARARATASTRTRAARPACTSCRRGAATARERPGARTPTRPRRASASAVPCTTARRSARVVGARARACPPPSAARSDSGGARRPARGERAAHLQTSLRPQRWPGCARRQTARRRRRRRPLRASTWWTGASASAACTSAGGS